MKAVSRYILKFFLVSIILFLVLFMLLYSLVEISFNDFLSANPKNFVPLLVISIIAIYFVYISIPLINTIKLKGLVKEALFIGTKKFIFIFISYLMILMSIVLSSFLVFYFLESNWVLLFISLVLLIFVFAWSKIYFSILVRKLSSL